MKVKYNRIKSIQKAFLLFFAFLVFLFSFSYKVKAQIGIKAGTTASNTYFSGSVNPIFDYEIDLRPFLGYDIEFAQLNSQKPLISPYLSTYYNFQILSRFGVRLELGFTQRGVNFSQFDYERIIYKIRISYIDLPVSFFYQFIQKEKSISELYIGGYGAFKIRAIKEVGSNYDSTDKKQFHSVNTFEGGLHFGVNYKRKFFEHFFLIDLRVFYGLSDIFSVPTDWTRIYFETQRTKTTGINLTLGYEF